MRRVAAGLAKRFPDEIRLDPRGFKRRVITAVRQALPRFAGRPAQAAVTLAVELRKLGQDWKHVYPQVILVLLCYKRNIS
jgi:hypothetical protein